MDAAEFYLPDECWECIFNFLNDNSSDDNHHRYLKSLSLVSKRFLSITNCLRFSLTIVWYPTRPFLGRFFQRYPNLTSLDLSCYYGDLNKLLCQISRFQSNLTSLNLSNRSTIPANGLQSFSQKISTLTSLKCSNMHSINSTDLFLIANCFPLLEELDLGNPIRLNDNNNFEGGVEALSLTLLKLHKINLSSHTYMNDQLLFVLFKNCKLLREAIIFNCHRITIKGIASAIRERPTLRSFELDKYKVVKFITSHFIDSLVSLKSLTSLDLTSLNISNEFLSSIAMNGLPLTRLVLRNCSGYTYDGILCLLSKSKCLQHLDLQYTLFLNNEHLYDTHIVQLSSFLSNLISINLSHCRKLTRSTLFALARNCLSLNEIKMEYTLIGKESAENSNSFIDFVVRRQLKSLRLAHNFWLRDENIIMFASMFPNLQLLDLSYCDHVSEGIFQVLCSCCKIRHLNLACCYGVKLLGMKLELPILEVLNLSDTNVDDETLYVTSKNCRGLLHLLLENCHYVTEKGVNHVLENCKELRDINLKGCNKVNANVVDSMVFSKPSLRKIVTPPGFDLNDEKKKLLFLRQGCRVC